MRATVAVLGLAVISACAAPPMGLGPGANWSGKGIALDGAAGFGAGPGRESFQAEASGQLNGRHVGIEAGMVYTQVGVHRDGESIGRKGWFPYIRPRLRVGRVSLATAVSGFALGAGGGGILGGIADVQLGVGGERWSIYSGAYALYYEALGGAKTWARQQRLGAEMWFPTKAIRIGVMAEVYHQRESLVDYGGEDGDPPGVTLNSDFFAAGIKLRVDYRELGW